MLGVGVSVSPYVMSYCLTGFFCFCAFEVTAGLWASSYMVNHRGIDVETAARFAALFYLGITAVIMLVCILKMYKLLK